MQHVETFGTRRTEERYASFGYPTGRLARLRPIGVPTDASSIGLDRAIGMRKGPPVKIFSITARACRPDSDSTSRVCVPICPRVRSCPYALVCFVTGERVTSPGNRNSGRVMGALIRNTISAPLVSNLAYFRFWDNYLECFQSAFSLVSLRNLRKLYEAAKIDSRTIQWLRRTISHLPN